MTAIRFARVAFFFFIIAAAIGHYLRAQTPSIQEFYQTLVAEGHGAPSLEALMRVTKQISGARPEEITKALPAIFAALAHQDEGVKHNACSALFEIARRPDGAALLRNHINELGQLLLTSPNPDTRAGAIIILGSIKPMPPPEVVPIFLTFLKRTDTEVQAQGSGIIFELVHIAPENPEVIVAVQDFLSRPLDSKSRRDALAALGNPRVKDAQIIAIMIASVDDPDQGIRITAIQALAGVGLQALQRAEPALQRLANDRNQPADVRAAARDALQRLHPNREP